MEHYSIHHLPAGKTSIDQHMLCFGAGMLVTSISCWCWYVDVGHQHGCVNNLFHIEEYEGKGSTDLMREAAKRPRVTLGELQRSTAQVGESVHRN